MKRKLNSYSVYIIMLILILKISYEAYSIKTKHDSHFQNNSQEDIHTKLILTDEEKDWLKKHPVIKVGSDPNWAPFEFRDRNGDYQGIDIDYLRIIEKKLGVKFEYSSDNTWKDVLESAKTKNVDLISSISITDSRLKYLNFTNVYISNPISIFANSEVTYLRNLEELNGKKVAVVDEYYTNILLSEKYPEIELIKAKNPQHALKLLKKGKVNAYVEGMVTASYYIGKYNYTDIRIVGDTPYDYNLRMAVRKDWLIFHTILQKTLNTFTESEKEYIYHHWISLKPTKKINLLLLSEILSPFLIILILFIFWNNRLRKEINRRKQVQNELNDTIEKLKNTQMHLVQSEKMSTVGVLTAGIAHEIKNPLNYIMMGIDGIKNGVESYEEIIAAYENLHPKLSEQDVSNILNIKEELDYKYYRYECESLTKSVQEGIENIHEITKSLNTFSYFAGKEMVLADINEGLKSTLVILRNQYKYHIKINTSYEDLQKIKCFPGKLNQVFVNLISNAIQAIKDKGTISIKSYKENDFVKISIKDDGEGMTDEVKQKIFSPFYTTKTIGKGTGLGLSISKNIIDEHNGTIEVISEKGAGSEFIISLPII